MNLVGGATQVGDKLRLTPTNTAQTSAAWNIDKQPVADGFETTFQFQINDLIGGGADGFAFVIQNSSATALGAGGSSMGYGNIPNSLAIEFDTWNNSIDGVSDPNSNHVAIYTKGTAPNSINGQVPLAVNGAIPNLSDGKVHTAKIKYADSSLQLFIDDMTAPALTAAIDLATTLNLDSGKAWVGFTAAALGGAENHDILNWTF